MTALTRRRCILISFAAFEGEAGERAALRLARRFGGVCEALLVGGEEDASLYGEPFGQIIDPKTGLWRSLDRLEVETEPLRQIARARRRLFELASSEGLEATVRVAPAASAAAALADARAEDVLIIAQPADPLTRRSFPFSAWGALAYRGPSLTVYAPPGRDGEDGVIIALACDEDDPALQFAKELGHDAGERVLALAPPDPASAATTIRAATRGAPVSMLVMTRGAVADDPAALVRLAADLESAIVVLEPDKAT